MQLYKFAILGVVLFLSCSLKGQYEILNNASRIQKQCYQLTPDSIAGFGQLVSLRTHNLDLPLTLYTQMYFGENDFGGNGITFFFQHVSNDTISTDSIYGLGANPNALAVEFDTNPNLDSQGQTDDPIFDHISLHRSHDFSHGGINNLQGPVIANPSGDIEDDTWYPVKIDWNPAEQRLLVFFDCEEVINYQGDIINDIFAKIKSSLPYSLHRSAIDKWVNFFECHQFIFLQSLIHRSSARRLDSDDFCLWRNLF